MKTFALFILYMAITLWSIPQADARSNQAILPAPVAPVVTIVPALPTEQPLYTISVNGIMVNTSACPFPAYKEKGILMVPLRPIAQALGYTMTELAKTKEILLENDTYRILLRSGFSEVYITKKTNRLPLSRTSELPVSISFQGNCLYVPLELFTYFSGMTAVIGEHISIVSEKATAS